ncbi:hypothetical protein RKD25_005559 [Streptomyces sp. SAI-124]
MPGVMPGKRGADGLFSACCKGSSSARWSAATHSASSSRCRSVHGSGSGTSSTRSGTTEPRAPSGVRSPRARQTESAYRDSWKVFDSRTTVWAVVSAGSTGPVEISCSVTSQPARLSRYSTQSAHIRFSAAYATTTSATLVSGRRLR